MAKALDVKTGSSTAKLILLKMCDNANDKGECWPSQTLIAEQCELSKRAVITNIKKLEKLGLVTMEKFGKNKNKYYINLSSADNAPLANTGDSVVHLVHSSSAPNSLLSSAPDSLAIEPINIEPIKEPTNIARERFEVFRKYYKGGKRGPEVEFNDFKKKHKNWIEVSKILMKEILRQEKERQYLTSKKQFVPCWKNLKTYLNQSCWEEQYATIEPHNPF